MVTWMDGFMINSQCVCACMWMSLFSETSHKGLDDTHWSLRHDGSLLDYFQNNMSISTWCQPKVVSRTIFTFIWGTVRKQEHSDAFRRATAQKNIWNSLVQHTTVPHFLITVWSRQSPPIHFILKLPQSQGCFHREQRVASDRYNYLLFHLFPNAFILRHKGVLEEKQPAREERPLSWR